MTSATSILQALLSQQRPALQTRKGLLVIGLQNDFTSPDGKLPVSVSDEFWPGLKSLIPAFRELGDIIWVRSEFDSTPRDTAIIGSSGIVEYDDNECDTEDVCENVEDDEHKDERDSPVPVKRRRTSADENESTPTLDAIERALTPESTGSKTSSSETLASKSSKSAVDEEFFLSSTPDREACCLRDSHGAELCVDAKSLLDENRDLQITTNTYSAFGTGSLLMKLRSKLVTELFICGCPTNSSVYATAIDAAQNGFEITLIEDCLAARSEKLNDTAIAQLCTVLEAEAMTSEEALSLLRNPTSREGKIDEQWDEQSEYDEQQVEDEDQGPKTGEAETQDQGLRGGGSILIVDDDSSISVQSIGDRAADVSPVLISARPLSLHLDDGLQDLHFSPFEAHNNVDTNTSHQESALLPSNSDQPHTSIQVTTSDESEHARPTEDCQDTEGGNRICERHSPELENTSASHDLTSNQCLEEADVHQFIKKNKHIRQLPMASSKHRGLNAIASLARLHQKTVDQYEELMKQARSANPQPLFGEGKETESKGSTVLYDLLPAEIAETVFDSLKEEISWQRMYHQTGEVPRLVCCQGSIAEDGSRPVYRHPSDQTLPSEPWTPTVDRIRRAAEEQVGHSLNHALIQYYRTGTDYISEHSDKTLDITKGTNIVNVSFGAQRTMRLRTKRIQAPDPTQSPAERTTYRVPMPHNSMIKMTLDTNAEYLHGINADKRPAVELSPAEQAYGGGRISLTFRNIGTFLDADSTRIWGQGATGKTRESARPVINGDAVKSEALIRAFGAENQATMLQWDATYGAGSDVLHLKAVAAKELPTS